MKTKIIVSMIITLLLGIGLFSQPNPNFNQKMETLDGVISKTLHQIMGQGCL